MDVEGCDRKTINLRKRVNFASSIKLLNSLTVIAKLNEKQLSEYFHEEPQTTSERLRNWKRKKMLYQKKY